MVQSRCYKPTDPREIDFYEVQIGDRRIWKPAFPIENCKEGSFVFLPSRNEIFVVGRCFLDVVLIASIEDVRRALAGSDLLRNEVVRLNRKIKVVPLGCLDHKDAVAASIKMVGAAINLVTF